MSEEKVSKSTKICATCALWGGSRSPDSRQWAKVDSNATGKCYDKNTEISKGSSCHKWEMWSLLR